MCSQLLLCTIAGADEIDLNFYNFFEPGIGQIFMSGNADVATLDLLKDEIRIISDKGGYLPITSITRQTFGSEPAVLKLSAPGLHQKAADETLYIQYQPLQANGNTFVIGDAFSGQGTGEFMFRVNTVEFDKLSTPGEGISRTQATSQLESASTTWGSDGNTLLLDNSFSLSSSETIIYTHSPQEWTVTSQNPAGSSTVAGHEIYTADSDGVIRKHSFSTSGSITSSEVLSELDIAKAELATGERLSFHLVLNGVTETSESIAIESKVTTKPLNSETRALYRTNKGLMVSTSDGLSGSDFLTPPATATANSEAQYNLLLNNTGNAAFSIPGGDDSVIQTVVLQRIQ